MKSKKEILLKHLKNIMYFTHDNELEEDLLTIEEVKQLLSTIGRLENEIKK